MNLFYVMVFYLAVSYLIFIGCVMLAFTLVTGDLKMLDTPELSGYLAQCR